MTIFPLEFTLPYVLHHVTSLKSAQYGRQIFYLQQQEENYWIKYQSFKGNEQYIAGFQKEKEIYTLFYKQKMSLPFWEIDINLWVKPELDIGASLLIPDAAPLLQYPPLDIDHAYQIIQRLINIVLVWHNAGWLHADLKPQHFVTYQNSDYLIDFEQVQCTKEQYQYLNATPHYMAPELFHHHQKTKQSDIYALGIIIYEWLSQLKLKHNTYKDWAVFHCQNSKFKLPQQYEVFQSLIDMMLHRHLTQRLTCLSLIKDMRNQYIDLAKYKFEI